MNLEEFLREVVTGEEGWLNISHSDQDGKNWTEEWYAFPSDLRAVTERVEQLPNHNVYFSPYLFKSKRSVKANAVVGRTIAADLDEANILTLQPKPTVLVQSSANRHQGYWVLSDALTADAHESISKRLTYSIPACDRSGWWIGHKFRLPTTNNFKWEIPQPVTILPSTHRIYPAGTFEHLPDVPSKNGQITSTDFKAFLEKAMKVSSGPQEYLEKVRDKLPPKVVTQYNFEAGDRSAALWSLELAAFRIGLSVEQVFFLARGSANNKFTSVRFNGDYELYKDVLRAQQQTYSEHISGNFREKIREIRRYPGIIHEKLAYMSEQIRENMKRKGQFINCADGTSWFVDNTFGRPFPIVARSEALQNLLEAWYGINPTERESSYVIGHLNSYVSGLSPVGRLASLSYFDTESHALYVHTGRKDVLRVGPKDITTVTNGYDSIVFHWSTQQEIIQPHYKHYEKPWEDILFDNALNNIIGLKKDEAKALLKVWLLMLLLRNVAVSRPILAIFGQPGAGKSTLFRRIYILLYGRGRSLSSITSPDNFDFATAADPLVVFDNVDTFERWLPDRLALAAAVSEVKKRKLYTNADTVTLTRQAFIGITAHNPKFGREDVTDRLIIITLERLTKFTAETDILGYIAKNRATIWGMIIQDIQTILSTEVPHTDYMQSFRIQDFALYGQWIANAVGCGKEFLSALQAIVAEQKHFALEDDAMLVEAIEAYINAHEGTSEFFAPSKWYLILEPRVRDINAFNRQYRNAVVLGKKFWTAQDALRTVFNVEWEMAPKRDTRLWKFSKKERHSKNGPAS